MADAVEDMIRTWVPDDFWQVAQPLIPVPVPRPQGGGKRRADDRAVLAAIVYLTQAGCSWRKLPAVLFGVSRSAVLVPDDTRWQQLTVAGRESRYTATEGGTGWCRVTFADLT